MRVKNLMTKNVICALPTEAVPIAARAMMEAEVGALPVVSDRKSWKLVGIVTDRDLCLRVLASNKQLQDVQVREVMTPNPIICRPEDDLAICESLMRKHRVRRIPVVDQDGKLLGIVAQADLALHAPAVELSRVLADVSRPVPHRPHKAA